MLKNIQQDKNRNIKLLSTGNFEGFTSEENVENKTLINCSEVITFPSGGTASIKYYNGKFIDSDNILASSKDNKNQFEICLLFTFKYKSRHSSTLSQFINSTSFNE